MVATESDSEAVAVLWLVRRLVRQLVVRVDIAARVHPLGRGMGGGNPRPLSRRQAVCPVHWV